MLPGFFPGKTRRRSLPVSEAFEHLTQEEAQKLIDMDGVAQGGDPSRRAGRHHLRRRDRQDRRARGRAGPGRQPRGRAARHPADRRGHDGQLEVRDGADRPHPVRRRRRVPRVEAVGSDSRAAGPLSDSRRARGARPRRVRPHPDRAEERADQAVHGADGHRRRHARVHARRRSSGSPSWRRSSTSAPRTSARGGCTPCMERLLDEVSFHAPELGGRSIMIDAPYVDRMLADIVEERRPVAVHPVRRRDAGRLRPSSSSASRRRVGVRQEGTAAAAAAPGAGRASAI